MVWLRVGLLPFPWIQRVSFDSILVFSFMWWIYHVFFSDVFRAGDCAVVVAVVSVVVVHVVIEWFLVQALRGRSVECCERANI